MTKQWYDAYSFDGHTGQPPQCYICGEEITRHSQLEHMRVQDGADDSTEVPVHKACLAEDEAIVKEFGDTIHSLAEACGINPDDIC